MESWIFHRAGEAIRGYGTEAEARAYLKHLNAGRVTRLFVMRCVKGWVNLESELSKIAKEQTQPLASLVAA